jgi:hypothetical protein
MTEDKNREKGMWARFPTTEGLTNRQLKAYHATILAVEAALCYWLFEELAAFHGPLVSAVFSIGLYGLVVSFDMYLIRKVLQVRAIRQRLKTEDQR